METYFCNTIRAAMAALKSAFTTGYHKELTNDGRVKHQDSFIASLLFMVLLTSIAISLSLAFWKDFQDIPPVHNGVISIAMSILFVLCSLFLCIYLCHKGTRNKYSRVFKIENENQTEQQRSTKREIIELMVPLIGIIVFLMGLVIVDIISIMVLSDRMYSCSSQNNTYSYFQKEMDGYHLKKDVQNNIFRGIKTISDQMLFYLDTISGIIFHILRSTYAILLAFVILIIRYTRSYLINLNGLRYILALNIAAVSWIYLDTAMVSFVDIFDTEAKGKVKRNINDTHFDCENTTRESNYTDLYDDTIKYLDPFIMEYCVIAFSCVAYIFIKMDVTETNSTGNMNMYYY